MISSYKTINYRIAGLEEGNNDKKFVKQIKEY